MITETRGYFVERPLFGGAHRVRCDTCSTTHPLGHIEERAEVEAAEWYRAHVTTVVHRRKLAKGPVDN